MWDMNDITAIEYRDMYTYWVQFDNGVSGEIDLKPYLAGEIFESVRDFAFFKQAMIDGGTIAWSNGADIAPETLYEQLEIQVSRVAEESPDYKTGNE